MSAFPTHCGWNSAYTVLLIVSLDCWPQLVRSMSNNSYHNSASRYHRSESLVVFTRDVLGLVFCHLITKHGRILIAADVLFSDGVGLDWAGNWIGELLQAGCRARLLSGRTGHHYDARFHTHIIISRVSSVWCHLKLTSPAPVRVCCKLEHLCHIHYIVCVYIKQFSLIQSALPSPSLSKDRHF